jgi:hypothetical protein
MSDQKSFTQAHYARSVLSVAQNCDREAAEKLVAGSEHDYPFNAKLLADVAALQQSFCFLIGTLFKTSIRLPSRAT